MGGARPVFREVISCGLIDVSSFTLQPTIPQEVEDAHQLSSLACQPKELEQPTLCTECASSGRAINMLTTRAKSYRLLCSSAHSG